MEEDRLGFWRIAEDHPERLAVVLPDDSRVSYGALRDGVNRLVHGLRSVGIERGQTVAAMLPNCVEFIEVLLATQQAGLYLTPINHHLTRPEIAYIIEDSDATAVVVHERFRSAAEGARRDAGVRPDRWFSVGAAPGFASYRSVVEGSPPDTPADRAAGALTLYTSGTTGRPKGVRRPLPEAGPDEAAAGYNILSLYGLAPGGDQIHHCGSPLYHAAPLAYLLSSLNFGHPVVLRDRWTPESFLADVERYGVVHTHMVPTHFNRLLALTPEERAAHDLSSLRLVVHAGAPCSPQVKLAMMEWLGPILYEYYGASEGVGGTFVSPAEALERPGTVGRPLLPGTRLSILDDDGRELGPGEVGTVYTTLTGAATLRYHKDEAKTQAARRGDLFTVGDLGYLDGDGYLYLVSRRTDLIISGGVNIYPAEIEAVIADHPNVSDVAVIGVPDEEWGESVKAVVELVGGNPPGEAVARSIREFCGERLARFKMPRTVEFVERMPRDANGKLYKHRLRDLHWASGVTRPTSEAKESPSDK